MAHPHNMNTQPGTNPVSPVPWSHAPPTRSTAPAAYSRSGFFSTFLSSPSEAIEDGIINPAAAAFVLFLSPLSTFLVTYATTWRAVTDQAQEMADNPWAFGAVSVPEVRAQIMDNFDWGAAFGSTVLHLLIAFSYSCLLFIL